MSDPCLECPLDLDGLIMSPSGNVPEFLGDNLNVGDDILENAISLSTCAGWLLTLDVFRHFSLDLRTRLMRCLPSFTPMVSIYFVLQTTNLNSDDPLRIEVEKFLSENPNVINKDSLSLFNPLSKLNNPIREIDLSILNGRTFLRKALLDRIDAFLKSKDKSLIDFSNSLFLPELLNPRFFSELSEGEMLVVLGMAGEYYRAASGFLKGRWAMGSALTSGLGANKKVNPVQALIKWILSGEIETTTLRVKLMAFKRFMAEVERAGGGRGNAVGSSAFKLLEHNKMMEMYDREQKEFQQKEISQTEFAEWLNNSHGLFESFELDCTLHNLDATMFWMELMLNPAYMKMVYGLIDFQDDDVKEKVLKEIGDSMTAFR